ncbi:MAG: hypothetical protein J6S96_01465 [Muribaculaceae bacterium]|nr:hypothetical protein [Muribaculaceae bacterium]
MIWTILWFFFWLVPQEKNRYCCGDRIYVLKNETSKKQFFKNIMNLGVCQNKNTLNHDGKIIIEHVLNDNVFEPKIYRTNGIFPVNINNNEIYICYNSTEGIIFDGIIILGSKNKEYYLQQRENNSIIKQARVIHDFENTVMENVDFECRPIIVDWWWRLGGQVDVYMIFCFLPYSVFICLWLAFKLNRFFRKEKSPRTSGNNLLI